MADIGVNLSIGGIDGLREVATTLAATSKNMKDLLSNINGLSNALDDLNKKAGKSNDKFKPENLKMAANEVQKLENQIALLKFKTKDATISTDDLKDALFKLGETKAELNKITNSYKLQQQEIKKTNAEVEKNAKAFQKVTTVFRGQIPVIAQLEARMSLLKQQMLASTDPTKVKALGVEIRKLADEKAKLTGGVTDLGKQSKLTMGIMGQFRGMVTNFIGVYAAWSGLKSIVNTMREYEKAMTMVKAVTNATTEEMEALYSITQNLVIKGSIFDPKTIAETQLELSKLGFTASEIAVMIEPINNLAIATGEDLTKGAEIATSAMRSFGLQAGDITRVVDVMGTALNISALDLSSWNEAMKYAAPVANQLGWSIEDVATMTSLLSNQQIKGSMAGTAMRQIFLKLADSNSNLQEAMGGNIKTFDDFTDGLQRMKDEGISLNQILEATDVRTSTAFSIMTDGIKVMKDMRDSFDEVSGSIKDMAETNLETLDSKIKQVNASWVNLITTMDSGNGGFMGLLKGSLENISKELDYRALKVKYPILDGFIEDFRFKKGIIKDIYQEILEDTSRYSQQAEQQVNGIYEKHREAYQNNLNVLRSNLNEGLITEEGYQIARQKATEEHNNKIIQSNRKSALDFINNIINLEKTISAVEKDGKKSSYPYIVAKETIASANSELYKFKAQIESAYSTNSLEHLNKEFTIIFNNIKDLKTWQEEGQLSLQGEAELRYQEMLLDALNTNIDRKKKNSSESGSIDDKFNEEALKKLKESAALEYQIKVNNIEANKKLTDLDRKTQLMRLKSAYDIQLNNLEKQEKDKIHLTETYDKLNLSIQSKTNTDIHNLNKTERLKNLKEMQSLEHKTNINYIKENKELDETAKEEAIAREKSLYKIKGYEIKKGESENAEIVEFYNKLIASEEKRLIAEIAVINDKANEEKIKKAYKLGEKLIKQEKRINDQEIALETIKLDTLKKQLNELGNEKGKKTEKRSLMEQIFGLEYEIEIKKAQREIDKLNQEIQNIYKSIELGTSQGKTEEQTLETLGIDKEFFESLKNEAVIAGKRIGLIVKENLPKEKVTLASVLGFEEEDFALIMQGVNEITSRISEMSNSVVASYKAMTEASQRRVEQLESELQTELQLAEQGFASNVTLKRKQLEEEKAIRDKNLEDQKKAQKAQLALQSTLDAANLVSTVIKLAYTQVATKGLAGIIATAVGAAGLFALVANIRAKSKEITSYEKGGVEYLQGKSHRQGGISLGEGREAQGGEMLAVFNKKATSKYGGEIENFVNAINKDKLKIGNNAITDSKRNIIVNMDNSKLNDIHGVLKQVRDNNVTYYGDYKVVKQGNRIRRVKINGI